MALHFGALRSVGTRAGGFLVAGMLAAAMTPAAALAADIPENNRLLATAVNGEVAWPDGQWSTYNDGGRYVWSTFVKGDGGHYGHYDLDVSFTVDGDTLKSIGVSSPGGVVGGAWSTNSSITGSLPQGVKDATVIDAEQKTVAPAVEGAEVYGGASWAAGKNSSPVQFYKAEKADDGTVKLGEAVSIAGKDGVYGYADADVNVVALAPKIGNWFAFKYYLDLGDEGLADLLNKQEATDYTASITGIGAKNRDMWTQTALASMVEQQLAAFVADEEYDLDIVTSATKSSDALIEALYASQGVWYPVSNNENPKDAAVPANWQDKPIFTKVADDLSIEMDGTRINGSAPSVTKDDAGNYVLTPNFSKGFDYTPNGETAVNLIGFDLYQVEGDSAKAQRDILASVKAAGGSSAFTPKRSVLRVIASAGNHSPLSELTAEDSVATENKTVTSTGRGGATTETTVLSVSGDASLASYDPATGAITVDPSITHVVAWYNHDTHNNYCGVVYDLAALAPAETPADDPSDSGSDAASGSASSSSSAGSSSSTAAKAVSIAKAKVTLAKASAAYTGKAQSGSVKSVKLGSTTLKNGTDYTVKAASGKKAGSYKVTVTGKGKYTGTATATFKITQAANKATAKSTSVKKTLKVAKLKKKAQTVALPKVTTKFGTAKWTVAKKDAKKVLSLKNGKVQVKKGAKKGTYTIKLKASVAKTANYKAASTKAVTVKVTVKK